MRNFTFLTLWVCSILFAYPLLAQTTPPAPYGATPNERQMKYLSSPMAAFIHFGMNTFAGTDGIEWGNDFKRPANTFNPNTDKVDTDQWVRLLKKAGFTRVIITLKHHDGFCTWPTKVTNYNISKSPYQNGNGDLAKELSESCDKYGLDMGIYLSPWDAWEPSYGDGSPGDYNDFYDNQLRELLGGKYGRLNTETGKREIVEIWLDGATGSGVAHQTYDFNRYVNTVRELQPNCLTWMTLGAAKNYSGPESGFPVDAFWVGNEKGYVNDPVWMKVAVNGTSVSQYNPNGQYISVPEADVSIRPGWFYHSSQDRSVKSLDYLIHNIYFRSIGMGIPLLLNVPPNRAGKFHENDSIALMQFGNALKNTFSTNLLTSTMQASASVIRGNGYEANKVLDDNYDTYWTMADQQRTGTLTIDLGKDIEMDVIRLQEYLPLGQRVSGWKVEVEVYGSWREYGVGQTIGYQRMIKGELLPVRKIRLTITGSQAVPLINGIQAYRSDESITSKGIFPPGINVTDGKDLIDVKATKVSKIKFEVLGFPSGSWPTIAEMRFYNNTTGELVEIERTNITATATSEAKAATQEPPSLVTNTLDNNASTIWQPEWYPNKVTMPQSLLYEFATPTDISHLSVEARKTNKDIPTKFNIYIAENPADEPVLSMAQGRFDANVNAVQFTPIDGTDWEIINGYSKWGNAIRSRTNDAEARFQLQGNWFRLIGTKSPATGILEVWGDDMKMVTIDTYSPTEQKNTVLYEGKISGTELHTIKVKATGTKNEQASDSKIILQNILKLEADVKGMFELSGAFAETHEDAKTFTFKISRYGNLNSEANVTYITTPGTGVHGKTYMDKTEIVHFAVGESEKEITVEIIDNTLAEGNKDFYIEINNPTDNHILGFNATLRVLVYDNDGDSSNSNLDGYCTPEGNQHPDKLAFLLSASTKGAVKDFSYTATECPETVYVKYLEDGIEAYRGTNFTLNLSANKAGERSTSDVYQDFRYNKAYLYADWNGDLTFSDDEKIAEYGSLRPSNNILGNYDEVMEISQEISIPDYALLQNIPLRVLYHNAWQTLTNGACSNVVDGMMYDFKLLIKNKLSGLNEIARKYSVFLIKNTQTIKCMGAFDANTLINVYNLNGTMLKAIQLKKTQQNVEIPINELSNGVYLVSINNNQLRETHKILK